MGSYNLQKRLSTIKKQAAGGDKGRIGFTRALLLSLFLGAVASSIVERSSPISHISSQTLAQLNGETRKLVLELENIVDSPTFSQMIQSEAVQAWRYNLSTQIPERAVFLSAYPLGASAANSYLRYSTAIVDDQLRELLRMSEDEEVDPIIDLRGWHEWYKLGYTNLLLRGSFVIIAFWPFWLVGGIIGFTFLPQLLRPKRTNDLLGVCDRKVSPFYSGLYGPLVTNNSISATNISCPNLACPTMAKKQVAINHPICAALKKFGALNETNIGLVQVILAYRDYPSFVEEERSSESETEEQALNNFSIDPVQTSSSTDKTVITNELGTIEKSSVEKIRALLEAHQMLVSYYRAKKIAEMSDKLFQQELSDLEALTAKLSPLAKILIAALTPTRRRAIATLPAPLIASAYLATEAGKSLVYRRLDRSFTQISRYPHLQARAVVQSLPAYHVDYNGDARLVIRQAILCARRHGDFGRAFLPINMPIASRGLRDWLEIFYSHPKKVEDTAYLTELDGHLEEIHLNFRRELVERLRAAAKAGHKHSSETSYAYWKGLLHKSVVLVPLVNLVEVALANLSEKRCERINELIALSRKRSSFMNISGRLPGFKRQAIEAEQANIRSEGLAALAADKRYGELLVTRWFIIRRMLTRYNWLSTRVGDDNVPEDGLVQAIFIDRLALPSPAVIGFDTLVPLRQRRYRELLGSNWERSFYSDAPESEDVVVHAESESFKIDLKRKMELAARTAADFGGGSSSGGSQAVG